MSSDLPIQPVEYRPATADRDDISTIPAKLFVASLVVSAAVLSALPMLFSLATRFGLGIQIFGLFQGILVGIGLRFILRRARVRRQKIIFWISLGASLIAIVSMQVGFYFWDVIRLYSDVVHQFGFSTGARKLGPFAIYNLDLKLSTGQGGLAGYCIMRLRNPVYPAASAIHAAATPVLCWWTIRSQASKAFCPSCRRWFDKSINAIVVPTGLAKTLVDAVQSNDPARGLALARVAADLPLGSSCAIARLYKCTCGEHQMDVVQKTFGRRGGELLLLKPIVVTKDFSSALRSDPVLPAENVGVPEAGNQRTEVHT